MRKFTRCAVLLLIACTAAVAVRAATVEKISIPSKKMGKSVPAALILPDEYKQSTKRFPVLYLLHGAGGSYRDWPYNTKIADLADEHAMIVVCPDGGGTSWYFDSPINPGSQYETFIAKECVDYIDAHYRSKADRECRAVCGYSMGGHGALFLGIRHRDVFGMASAISGGVDIRPFPNNWGIKDRIGDIRTHRGNWDKFTVINLAKGLKNGELAISLDCGDKDFFLRVNRALRDQLMKDGIAHDYVERPGGHDWDYWKDAIKRQIPIIDGYFRRSTSWRK